MSHPGPSFVFKDLEKLLSELEKDWRSKFTTPLKHRFIRETQNLQYFVLDSATKAEEVALPVVVLVGVNYTQDPSEIPDQEANSGSVYSPAVVSLQDSRLRARIRSADEHRRLHRPEWEDCALIPGSISPSAFPEEYHLVLANLSPYITTHWWQSDMCENAPARGGDLIASPPYQPKHAGWPFDHLADLNARLNLGSAWWIGHGRDAVWPRWHSIAREVGVEKWLLVGNLFARQFAPDIRASDVTVKFA